MSGRYHNYDKGSSRSTRDVSRPHKEGQSRERRRSRSRSPRRWSPGKKKNYSPERSPNSRERDLDDRRRRRSHEFEEPEDVPPPPPPPRITKISIDFNKPKAPIKMNLGGPAKVVSKPTVASVFKGEDDDDDEPEQMPAEARMRMRNIGRETPTSAGPNSFGKTKQGFCDAKKVFEKNLKQALDMADKPSTVKLPQTIYKIKGP